MVSTTQQDVNTRRSSSLLTSMTGEVRPRWKQLAVTDVFYKVIAFVALTPLVSLLLRMFISLSGKSVLADQDILFFLLSPLGWICVILVGSVSVAIAALELTALIAILSDTPDPRMSVVRALRFTAARAWAVLQVTARAVATGLLAAAPFAVGGGLAYVALLTEYDINYYLTERPPRYYFALAIGAVLGCGLLVVTLRLATSWLFALPLLLLENVRPSRALRESRLRTRGHRGKLLLWLVAWAMTGFVVSSLASSLVSLLGRVVIAQVADSLPLLVFTVGMLLVLLAVVNLGLSLFSVIGLATMLVCLYRKCGTDGDSAHGPSAAGQRASDGLSLKLTRKRLVLGTLAASVIAAGVGFGFLRGIRVEDRTTVTAHRGASGAAPENTLAAIQQAIDDGADFVEIDVQETSDGEVVVMHDSDFKKIAGTDLKIWDATLEQLADLDIGSWISPRFSDQRVPTLDRVLETCKGKIGVNIELKHYGRAQQLEQRVIDIVEEHEMQSRIVIMSLKADSVAKVKKLRPDWKVGLLTAVSIGDLTRVKADFLAVSDSLATSAFIRDAHRAGKEVYVWTVNDPVMMSAVIGRGADSIITDEPALARAVLEQRRQMSSIERLLVEVALIFDVVPESVPTSP